MMDVTQIGLEVLRDLQPGELSDCRIGLLMNQASVDQRFRYACDVIHDIWPRQLRRLFSPQHGFWGEQQANMIESADTRYRPLNLPVHSLYSSTRCPTPECLQDLDVLMIDLQDVGTRVYTFIWTMFECLRACAAAGVRIVILDRPNPLGGLVVEGPLVADGFRSFVGNAAIPMRHGLTIGELALLLNAETGLKASVSIIPMRGWNRSMLWADTRRNWVLPSPNMPWPATAFVYPGQVLLEGTNLSEGRGTTRPFEFCGAPWLDPDELVSRIPRQNGVELQPIRFRPTFDKWQGQTCGGLAIHVTDSAAVRSFRLTLEILSAVRTLAPDEFRWLGPPYEYEFVKPPIDILFGDQRLRTALDRSSAGSPADLDALAAVDVGSWRQRTAAFRLYPE